MSTLLRNFDYIVIPAAIWLRRDISIQAKALWAEIYSLYSPENGGCYASEEYLCEFMGVLGRRLRDILKELRDAKLLETVSSDGRHVIRKAIDPRFVDMTAEQVGSILPTRQAGSCLPDRQFSAAPHIYIKEDKKEERESARDEKVLFGKMVTLTQTDYDKLCTSNTKSIVDEYIEKINDYCESKGKSYVSYSATIRQWIRRDQEKDSSKSGSRQVLGGKTVTEYNKLW